MPLKIVWEFSQGKIGWSETYYAQFTDPGQYITLDASGNLQACPANSFFLLRQALLNTSCTIDRVRASVVNTPRQVLVADLPEATSIGQFGAGTAPGRKLEIAAENYSKLLLRFNSGFSRVRSLWLGGLPDIIIKPPNQYAPNSAWNTALLNLSRILINGSYGVVSRPTPTTNPAAVPITSFTTAPNANGASILPIVQPGAPLPASWYVVIRGVKYPKGWNGVHRATIQGTAPNQQLVIGPTRKPYVTLPAWDAFAQGSVQLMPQTAIFSTWTSYTTDRIEQRKVGRPFGQPAGRARSL